MTSRHTLTWIARALGVALVAAATGAGAQTVKIGNTGALTGPYNEFGEGTRRGIELAQLCQSVLARAQQQVKVLEENALKNFPSDDESSEQ